MVTRITQTNEKTQAQPLIIDHGSSARALLPAREFALQTDSMAPELSEAPVDDRAESMGIVHFVVAGGDFVAGVLTTALYMAEKQ